MVDRPKAESDLLKADAEMSVLAGEMLVALATGLSRRCSLFAVCLALSNALAEFNGRLMADAYRAQGQTGLDAARRAVCEMLERVTDHVTHLADALPHQHHATKN